MNLYSNDVTGQKVALFQQFSQTPDIYLTPNRFASTLLITKSECF